MKIIRKNLIILVVLIVLSIILISLGSINIINTYNIYAKDILRNASTGNIDTTGPIITEVLTNLIRKDK